jgi:transposase
MNLAPALLVAFDDQQSTVTGQPLMTVARENLRAAVGAVDQPHSISGVLFTSMLSQRRQRPGRIHLEPDRAGRACRVVDAMDGREGWCHRCGVEGARDTVTRRLAHVPLGWQPTTLLVTIRRYKCTGCGHVWRQDVARAAEPPAKLTRTALRWALEGIGVQHLTVARVAKGLGVAWNIADRAFLAEGRRFLIDDANQFDGAVAIGVDEHFWRHTRRGDKYITVVIDLIPIGDGTGPARLLDMVDGRSKSAFKKWLAERPRTWRDAVEVVAMDGFTGFKTAAAEEVPDAVAVMRSLPRLPTRRPRPGPVPAPDPTPDARPPRVQGRPAP